MIGFVLGFDKALFALMLASAGDAATTEWALGNRTVAEANPLVPGEPWQRIATKAGVTVGIYYGSRHLDNAGHPKLAKFTRWFPVVLFSAATVNNLIVAHR